MPVCEFGFMWNLDRQRDLGRRRARAVAQRLIQLAEGAVLGGRRGVSVNLAIGVELAMEESEIVAVDAGWPTVTSACAWTLGFDFN
jgi:hypothetical protein